MKYSDVAGCKISKMSLGTVQFGLHYGIANDTGKPAEDQSHGMIETALDLGITSIDTARAYGDSEDIIGRYFKKSEKELPFISTKVAIEDDVDPKNYEAHIIESVETSLEKLGVNKVNNIMLHDSQWLFEYGGRLSQYFGDLIKRGYCDMVGVSMYSGADIDKMLEYDVFTSTQIPLSIFDQRLINSGHTKKLYERNITMFVRSVFLQGLFFLEPGKITDPILAKHALPRILKLHELCEKEGLTIAEMAITFLRDMPGVTSLVLGADNSEQIKSNIHYFDAHPLSEETTDILKKTFADVNIPEIMKVLSRPK
ncbi:MAG: aldo/keto reductase [Ruminococcaceae bacterium]|nr:aldo/keto reductase [Oscillospiraceae bacterium]